MTHVIHLFVPKGDVSRAAYQDARLPAPIRVAIAQTISSTDLLARKIRELGVHLDNVDRVIDDLPDSKVRQALRDLAKVNRESLIAATRELALQVRKLPGLIRSNRESAVVFDHGRGAGSGRG
jgi:hypothetical protein